MVFLDCGPIDPPDLRAVNGLARTTLRCRREGSECRLMFASRELLDLITFIGLDDVLKTATGFPPRAPCDDLRRPGAAAA